MATRGQGVAIDGRHHETSRVGTHRARAPRLRRSDPRIGSALASGPALAQEWKPAQNVDIVVASGAGGSSDRTARVVQNLLQANPAFPSISVTNRPGGGGTVVLPTGTIGY